MIKDKVNFSNEPTQRKQREIIQKFQKPRYSKGIQPTQPDDGNISKTSLERLEQINSEIDKAFATEGIKINVSTNKPRQRVDRKGSFGEIKKQSIHKVFGQKQSYTEIYTQPTMQSTFDKKNLRSKKASPKKPEQTKRMSRNESAEFAANLELPLITGSH